MKKLFLLFVSTALSVSMFAANITCAEAKAKIDAGDKAEYTVEGFVTAVIDAPDPAYKNLSFWMDDKAGGGQVFEVYRLSYDGQKAEDIPVVGDKVAVTATLKKYTPKEGDPIYETDKIKEYTIVTKGGGKRYTDDDLVIGDVNVKQALEIGMALKGGEKTTKSYKVTGYLIKIAKNGEYSEQYGNQSFYMSDDPTATKSDFEAYRAKIDAPGAKVGDKVSVTGFIERYDGSGFTTIEISGGVAEIVTPAAPAEEINVAKAVELGTALADNAKTDKQYTVVGYVVKAYEPKEGYNDQTWFMADEKGAFGEFEAYQCTADELVKDDDYVAVTGYIVKFVKDGKTTIEISKGTAEHREPQAIDNIFDKGTKAIKVMENGQLFIIREGIKYNVTGAVAE